MLNGGQWHHTWSWWRNSKVFSPMMIMGTNATTYSSYSNPFQEWGSALSSANRDLCVPNVNPHSISFFVVSSCVRCSNIMTRLCLCVFVITVHTVNMDYSTYVGLLLYRCVDWVIQRGMLWDLVVFLCMRYPCHDNAMSDHWMSLRSSNILMGLCEVCYMLWKRGFECSYMPHDVGVVAVVNNYSSSTTLNHAILPV